MTTMDREITVKLSLDTSDAIAAIERLKSAAAPTARTQALKEAEGRVRSLVTKLRGLDAEAVTPRNRVLHEAADAIAALAAAPAKPA